MVDFIDILVTCMSPVLKVCFNHYFKEYFYTILHKPQIFLKKLNNL